MVINPLYSASKEKRMTGICGLRIVEGSAFIAAPGGMTAGADDVSRGSTTTADRLGSPFDLVDGAELKRSISLLSPEPWLY